MERVNSFKVEVSIGDQIYNGPNAMHTKETMAPFHTSFGSFCPFVPFIKSQPASTWPLTSKALLQCNWYDKKTLSDETGRTSGMEEAGVSVSRAASSPSAMFTVCTAPPPLFTVYKTLITSYRVISLAHLSLLELEYLDH